ncbi:hypothetical protein ADUPG1_013224 [Aduncisulcus paluster]|uniref:Uncharacterized protein n=1 Tax=Aduncisulcus paluster TaxID=2918883 RepID=A0ABQ5K263_9EUKA|nr:hypothetical protein ADUPG1_013224 [Aduncisulcus paluster]
MRQCDIISFSGGQKIVLISPEPDVVFALQIGDPDARSLEDQERTRDLFSKVCGVSSAPDVILKRTLKVFVDLIMLLEHSVSRMISIFGPTETRRRLKTYSYVLIDHLMLKGICPSFWTLCAPSLSASTLISPVPKFISPFFPAQTSSSSGIPSGSPFATDAGGLTNLYKLASDFLLTYPYCLHILLTYNDSVIFHSFPPSMLFNFWLIGITCSANVEKVLNLAIKCVHNHIYAKRERKGTEEEALLRMAKPKVSSGSSGKGSSDLPLQSMPHELAVSIGTSAFFGMERGNISEQELFLDQGGSEKEEGEGGSEKEGEEPSVSLSSAESEAKCVHNHIYAKRERKGTEEEALLRMAKHKVSSGSSGKGSSDLPLQSMPHELAVSIGTSAFFGMERGNISEQDLFLDQGGSEKEEGEGGSEKEGEEPSVSLSSAESEAKVPSFADLAAADCQAIGKLEKEKKRSKKKELKESIITKLRAALLTKKKENGQEEVISKDEEFDLQCDMEDQLEAALFSPTFTQSVEIDAENEHFSSVIEERMEMQGRCIEGHCVSLNIGNLGVTCVCELSEEERVQRDMSQFLCKLYVLISRGHSFHMNEPTLLSANEKTWWDRHNYVISRSGVQGSKKNKQNTIGSSARKQDKDKSECQKSDGQYREGVKVESESSGEEDTSRDSDMVGHHLHPDYEDISKDGKNLDEVDGQSTTASSHLLRSVSSMSLGSTVHGRQKSVSSISTSTDPAMAKKYAKMEKKRKKKEEKERKRREKEEKKLAKLQKKKIAKEYNPSFRTRTHSLSNTFSESSSQMCTLMIKTDGQNRTLTATDDGSEVSPCSVAVCANVMSQLADHSSFSVGPISDDDGFSEICVQVPYSEGVIAANLFGALPPASEWVYARKDESREEAAIVLSDMLQHISGACSAAKRELGEFK